jgi:hypothetical protein
MEMMSRIIRLRMKNRSQETGGGGQTEAGDQK